MNKFYQLQHLEPDEYGSFQGESPITKIEQVLQRISQQVHNHNVAISFFPDVEHVWYVDLLPNFLRLRKVDDEFRLQKQLRSLNTGTFYLKRHLRAIFYITAQVDLSKGSFAQFLNDLVVTQHTTRLVRKRGIECVHAAIIIYHNLLSVQINRHMFQPHSVRGLLSRRNKTRLQGEQQLDTAASNAGDADLDTVVEGKLFIKDIQHKIQDIRQWRDHQTSLLKERLASNQAVAKVTVDQYLKHLDRQQQIEEEERQKIVKKLQIVGQEMQLGVENTGWNSADTNLFECLAASNRTVDERKYELETGEVGSNTQAFINDLQTISETILRREDKATASSNQKPGVDRALLKKQLQEIDDQLREIEELLKD